MQEAPHPAPRCVPAFLSTGTAALLTPMPPAVSEQEAGAGLQGLGSSARRLWEELLRRLEGGETRLYAADLLVACALEYAELETALQALREAGFADWDEPGPYLYLRRPVSPSGELPEKVPDAAPAPPAGTPPAAGASAPAQAAVTSSTAEVREDEVQKVFAALEWATGSTLSPLARERIPEWLSVLGLRGLLDEIGLCREQGRRRFSQLSLALDRACNRRRSVSPFGPLEGRGVVPVSSRPGAHPAGKAEGIGVAPEAVPNVGAYDPVAPEVVRAWVEAHPGLSTGDPAPPLGKSMPGAERQGTWASAYDPVPEAVVKAWVEAFSEEYHEYQREYRRLAERSGSGPFRSRRPRVR